MNKNIRYINALDQQNFLDYAQKLLHTDTNGWRISDELTSIMVSNRTVHDHYWEELGYVKFKDYEFNINDNVFSTPVQSFLWAKFVYENLPNELKNDYAKEYNELYSDAAEKDYRSLFTNGGIDFKLPIMESELAETPAK